MEESEASSQEAAERAFTFAPLENPSLPLYQVGSLMRGRSATAGWQRWWPVAVACILLLIALLVVLVLALKPILFVQGRPSVTPTTRQDVPSATPTHLDEIVRIWALPAGAAVAVGGQANNQMDVFAVDRSGALTIAWVVGSGTWNGPTPLN